MKKVATLQDISCVGKCSLTVALPVLSAMGIETAVIPTAVLSTHTQFKNFTFHDLTDEILPILSHWKDESFEFDGIYTGYLGSFEQLEIAKKLIDDFGQKLAVVDPCMADNGKLYPGFTPEFALAMANLCAKADVICPNLTEAAYLLGEEYLGIDYTEEQIQDLLQKLARLGCKKVILTGVSLDEETLGVYAYDSENESYMQYYREELQPHFHGTGDIWASTFTGALIDGFSFEESAQIACDFVCDCIQKTIEEENHNEYGVNFELALPSLIKRIQK